ncbi:hypothetical protein JTE90_021309 [Oedothorax gibbosus]|uniref:Uncharacterized protein n=1 Tax=Oedothorax gibbosus TaxID=931172 RepID=A0AAV6VLR3_9ARAC|nr:hypothetical protein JTE90_021309 [Oedothorax gibbosus]
MRYTRDPAEAAALICLREHLHRVLYTWDDENGYLADAYFLVWIFGINGRSPSFPSSHQYVHGSTGRPI